MIRRFVPAELSSVKQWTAAQGGAIWDFLGSSGGAQLAVAFSSLFWPMFVEVEGCVFLQERYDPSNFREWWRKLCGDARRVEGIVNHVHLWDLFDLDEQSVPEEALQDLAEILSLTWACALRSQFPDRSFDVRVDLDGTEEYGPTISFSTSLKEVSGA